MHKNFEAVEQYIKSLNPLSLAMDSSYKEPDLYKFITNFLMHLTNRYDTIEYGVLTGHWARRTIKDIYRLCLTYVSPDVKLYDTIETLFKISEDKRICFRGLICGGIDKRVWRVVENGSLWIGKSFFWPEDVGDEYGLDYSEFIKKYHICTLPPNGILGVYKDHIDNYIKVPNNEQESTVDSNTGISPVIC